MKGLLFVAVILLSTAAHGDDFDRYSRQVFLDEVKEMKADIKELTRKVTAIDKDALTKSDAKELRDSINALQLQIATLEGTTKQLPVTKISELDNRTTTVEGDLGWMKKLLGFTAVQASLLTVSLIVVGAAWVLNRRKNGDSGGGGSWRGWPGARNWYSQEGEE